MVNAATTSSSSNAGGTNTRAPLRVAVVGSGIAGLSAAWLLNQYPAHFDVTVYEREDYVGGHTHTVDVPPLREYAANPAVTAVPVDTGFIVCNPVTYPNFMRFLDKVGVPLTQSDMSFAVSRNRGAFEWAGDTLFTLFAQRKNVFDFSRKGVWVMLYDVMRFHWIAAAIADAADEITAGPATASPTAAALYAKYEKMSIGEFLAEGNYSQSFKDNFLTPQTAAIWSTPAGTCLSSFPIISLVNFFKNHRMLQLVGRPNWLTVPLGSRQYACAVSDSLPRVHLNRGIRSITRNFAAPPSPVDGVRRNWITVTDDRGDKATFDHVILATHGDISRSLIKDLTPAEAEVLGKVSYGPNRAVLHRDPALMPVTRSAWSSWNYLTRTGANGPADSGESMDEDGVCVTYWMNRLQPFIPRDTHGDVFLTINPLYEPDPALVIDEYSYDHPIYSFNLVQAQDLLPTIANLNGLGFAGAWCNHGFHEDGCTAGLVAAAALGASPPFPLTLNGGYPTRRKVGVPLAQLPLLPSPDVYHANLAAHLPEPYLAASPSAAKAASAAATRAPVHTVEMSAVQVATGLVPVALARILPASVARLLPACLVGTRAREPITWIKAPEFSTVPVPAVSAAAVMGLTAQVRVLELAERWAVSIAFFVVGVPLLVFLYVLGLVEVEDPLATSAAAAFAPKKRKAEVANGVAAAPTGKKELVWVSPRMRVVWKS
ncbi:hypothetical protein H9P43_002643 [Blastocladiella emersonii ATCC 22665]|nr:hypothetical protein H9P43_002643 [Blastocladiella emersonii ATCC 22665]